MKTTLMKITFTKFCWQVSTGIYGTSAVLDSRTNTGFSPFRHTGLFLYSLKTLEKLQFSDIFRVKERDEWREMCSCNLVLGFTKKRITLQKIGHASDNQFYLVIFLCSVANEALIEI